MFKSAIFKLTAIYLLILMSVSMLFSLNLYRISTYEINNRLRRQVAFINSYPFNNIEIDLNPFESARQKELTSSRKNIALQLLYANLVILVIGGFGSFLLAKYTLKPLEEAHEAQIRFTADASHELRTPLAALLAETEVALRDPKLSVKNAREILTSNVEELKNLSNLSDGLLQLARGVDPINNSEIIQIRSVLEDAIKKMNPLAKNKNIKIQLENVPQAIVIGDKASLTQLFVILLDNATKYSPRGTSIKINVIKIQNQIQIKVSDSGMGIKKADLPHIFERFYRQDQSRSKQKTKGYGLGLSIALQIVQAHKGSIEATSKEGSGSVFTVSLPYTKT